MHFAKIEGRPAQFNSPTHLPINILSTRSLSRYELVEAMMIRGASVLTIHGVTYRLVSIEREDGSGHSFNLTLTKDNQMYRCYCRTSD